VDLPVRTERPAVLVSGPSERVVRGFLAAYVKPAFGLKKPQWRVGANPLCRLAVLSRPLRAGEDAAAVLGPYAAYGALVLAGLGAGVPGTGRGAALAWLKASGFGPVAELALPALGAESERIDLGAEVVNFINARCDWRNEPLDGRRAYLDTRNRPFRDEGI